MARLCQSLFAENTETVGEGGSGNKSEDGDTETIESQEKGPARTEGP